jgi:hypothetical protein
MISVGLAVASAAIAAASASPPAGKPVKVDLRHEAGRPARRKDEKMNGRHGRSRGIEARIGRE